MLKIEKIAIEYLFQHHCKICAAYMLLRCIILLVFDLLLWMPLGIIFSIGEYIVLGTWHWICECGESWMLEYQKQKAMFACVGRAWKGAPKEEKEGERNGN